MLCPGVAWGVSGAAGDRPTASLIHLLRHPAATLPSSVNTNTPFYSHPLTHCFGLGTVNKDMYVLDSGVADK